MLVEWLATDWLVIVLWLLTAIPLAIFWARHASRKHLERAIDQLLTGEEVQPDSPLHRAIEFYTRRQNLNALAKLEELKEQVAEDQQHFQIEKSELYDERFRLESQRTQLEDKQRYQLATNICTQSLARDFVSAVNEGETDRAKEVATHLTALLRPPFTASDIKSCSILELIDEVLVRLAPMSARNGCRYLVVPGDITLSDAEINAPAFQDILYHLLIQSPPTTRPGNVGIDFRISENSVTLTFSSELYEAPAITIDLDEALSRNAASWVDNKLIFPVRPHPGVFATETDLRALVVADSELERRSVTSRLAQLGLETTTDFNSGTIDICVVADETSESFRAVHPYLSDSTYVLMLGNRSIYQNPLWLQVEDPITQKGLAGMIQDIAVVKDETTQKRILAVDDSQANIQLLEMQLTELGHTVTVARSGTEALAQVEKSEFDLVFMDIQMPDLSGDETTRQIRTFNQKLPIVGLTAHATVQEREAYNAAGIDDVLIKPVRMENLKSLIHRLGKSSPRPPLPVTAGSRVPIFDMDLSLANANNRFELAAELLDLLIASLPEDQKSINDMAGDHKALKKAVHKLHGAVRYCGVPRLNRAIEKLESALKQNDTHQVPLLLNLLNGEIAALVAWRRENPDILDSQ